MSDPATENPGTLVLPTLTATKRFTLAQSIPLQVLYLESYRVQVTDSAAALAIKEVMIDLPFLSRNQFIDDLPSRTYIRLFLDGSAVTNASGKNEPINLGTDISEDFDMVVRSPIDYTPLTSLVSVHLKLVFTHGRMG